MTAYQKENLITNLYKTVAIALISICAFFLKQIHDDFSTTKEVVHDLELKVNTIQVDIEYIKQKSK
jgi:hypothetical protein